MESFNDYLKQFPNYTPAVYAEALPFLSRKTIPAGEYYLREGKICRSVAFIERGLLRLYYLTDGKEVTNCFCKEQTITTSYASLITQQASELAIQAISTATLIELPYPSLQILYQKNSFWQQLGRMAAEQEAITLGGHNRFINDLTATERYLHILERDPSLLQSVPLQYLASYLQVSPETLSRIRSRVGRT